MICVLGRIIYESSVKGTYGYIKSESQSKYTEVNETGEDIEDSVDELPKKTKGSDLTKESGQRIVSKAKSAHM